MTEPSPVYHALPHVDLEALERQLTAALVAVWKAQGKRRKIVTLPIVTLPSVDNPQDTMVIYKHS